MKRKPILKLIFLLSALAFGGCAKAPTLPLEKENKIQTEFLTAEQETEELPEAQKEALPETRKEVLTETEIAYPFSEPEEYTLTLTTYTESPQEHVLVLSDKYGEILQQIPCGRLTEPIEFSFDGIAYGSWNNLEIFPSESEEGLLFCWEDGLFSTEAAIIPRYTEARGTAMLTVKEDEKSCEKQIFSFNEAKNRSELVRSFLLQKDSGMLEIRDELEKVTLYDGTIRLDAEGKLVNEEYFDQLLWSDINLLWDYGKEEEPLYTWVEDQEPRETTEEVQIDSFEDAQYYIFGNQGHTQEYASREALLEDCGFESCEPMFRYFDRYGNLNLELYADEEMEEICGITYTYVFDSELEKQVSMCGFSLCTVCDVKWEGKDPYIFHSVYGSDGSAYAEDYEESIEYTEAGKPDHFVARGRVVDRPEPDVLKNLIDINFIYREDGTLFCRDYSHDSLAIGTTLCSLDSFYDEKERIVFERGYITHGHLEYYYIYEDKEGETALAPSYILLIDYNLNYAIPRLMRCR